MRDVEPAVVRVIDVPAASSLAELHELFQAALGWTDSQLHRWFEFADERKRGRARAWLADLGYRVASG